MKKITSVAQNVAQQYVFQDHKGLKERVFTGCHSFACASRSLTQCVLIPPHSSTHVHARARCDTPPSAVSSEHFPPAHSSSSSIAIDRSWPAALQQRAEQRRHNDRLPGRRHHPRQCSIVTYRKVTRSENCRLMVVKSRHHI